MKCLGCGSDAHRITSFNGNEVCENCAGYSISGGTKVDGSLMRVRKRQESVMHEGDFLPPFKFDKTTKKSIPNPDFVRAYPAETRNYYDRDELKKHGLEKALDHSNKVQAQRKKKADAAEKKVYSGGK